MRFSAAWTQSTLHYLLPAVFPPNSAAITFRPRAPDSASPRPASHACYSPPASPPTPPPPRPRNTTQQSVSSGCMLQTRCGRAQRMVLHTRTTLAARMDFRRPSTPRRPSDNTFCLHSEIGVRCVLSTETLSSNTHPPLTMGRLTSVQRRPPPWVMQCAEPPPCALLLHPSIVQRLPPPCALQKRKASTAALRQPSRSHLR